MLIGAVVGLRRRRSRPATRGSGVVTVDARRRAAEPPPRDHHDHVPRRPGRVRPGADVPRHGARPGARARGSATPGRSRCSPGSRSRCSRRSRCSARSRSPSRASSSTSGYLLVPAVWYWIHRTRPGLHLRVGRRGAGGGRRARRERVRDPLPLRVHRRDAGGPRRGDDHARDPARLVRGAHGERPGLDRRRARDLRPVVAVPGRRPAPTCSGSWCS